MQQQNEWYQMRQQWRKPTNVYVNKQTQVYSASQLTIDVCDSVGQIIMATRGKYPKFNKKINLVDLVQLVSEVWEDDD